jgi:hypothetical protein
MEASTGVFINIGRSLYFKHSGFENIFLLFFLSFARLFSCPFDGS